MQLYLRNISSEISLPIFLYNMPSHTKIKFELDTLRQAFEIANIVGLKDSSGDMTYFREAAELIRNIPDCTMLVGPERLLVDALRLGGHGGVSGGANLQPRLFVDLYEAAVAGDQERTAELRRLVALQGEKLYSIGAHGSAFIKGVKCALSCLGICDDGMAEPFQRFREEKREQVRQAVRELGLSRVNAM